MKKQAVRLLQLCCYVVLGCVVIPLAMASPPGIPRDYTSYIDYDIQVRIDPATRMLEGKSLITFNKTRDQVLKLGAQFEVTHAFIDGVPFDPQAGRDRTHVWQIPYAILRPYHVEIHWRGKLHALDDSLDHEQTLRRPVAVSGEAGTFLPNSSSWYPRVVNALIHYAAQIELPPGQRGLVAGHLVDEQDTDAGYLARFEFPHPAEGIDLMAGPYTVTTENYTGVQGKPIALRTYFHPQIDALADEYLETVKRYFKLYESWIGAYPFSEFSIVSSPTPTGFGMPTLTYLGINVLQLPFIKDTSLGHEVLHNWWGNAVYPDYQSGNWSEGLTTFMADYTYKEQESEAAARDMRLGWLRDFAALEPGQDEPLAAFTSRTHGASKIVGYHKSAMLFFMLRDLIGEDMFNRSIKGIWAMQRFKITSWTHLQNAFAMITVSDLDAFFDQWLNRSGAPQLTLTAARQEAAEDGYRLQVTLSQSEPPYQLRVPVAVQTESGEETHVLDLQHVQQTFDLAIFGKAQAVMLDPDIRLFRQLAPGEAPPILREVMVNATTATIIVSPSDETREIALELAGKLQRRQPQLQSADQPVADVPTLVIGLQHEIDVWLEARVLPARPAEVDGNGSAQAWTLTVPGASGGTSLAVVSARDNAALEALIRPLPHYGRQSYIVFDGRQATDRGVWPVQVQQLAVE